MKTIWKYSFDVVNGKQGQLMPKNARIVSVHMQDAMLCIWAKVDTEASVEQRNFEIVGTGHLMPEGVYVGTAFDSRGFVWHLYEVL